MIEAKRRVGLTLGTEACRLAVAWMRCGCQMLRRGDKLARCSEGLPGAGLDCGENSEG